MWGTDRDGRPVLVKVVESIGDTLGSALRGPGGAAVALKDVVEPCEVEVPSTIVREQREYVRRISCVIDAPAEVAREVLAGYCSSFPVPPGCRLVIGGDSGISPSGLMSAPGWGLVLAAAAAGIAAVSVRNSVRTALVLAASLPAAGIATCFAVVLVPRPADLWALCAGGVVMIACGAAGLSMFSGRNAGNKNTSPLSGTLTVPLEGLFGHWVLMIGALAPFVLVSMATNVPVALHAPAFAIVCSLGVTVGLLLIPLTLPAWIGPRS
jgi:hypothetical protein